VPIRSLPRVGWTEVFTRAMAGRLTSLTITGLVAVAALAPPSGAALRAGGFRVDRTFGGGRGFVTTRISGTSSVAYGATAVSRGDIVVAGQASPPDGNGQVVVARYLPSGRLDPGFGTRGIFQSTFPTADAPFIANAIAVDRPTGKIIVAGGYGQGSMLVMRLTGRGRLDRTFGLHGSGFATVEIGGTANSLAIQRDGRILLGGSNANRPGRPFVVARFTRNGVLDRSFAHGGVAQVLFWNPSAAAGTNVATLVPTADGGVIGAAHIDYIGGTGHHTGGHGASGVFRLTRHGVPFRAFGTGGHAQITFFDRRRVPQTWYPCATTVDGRGRVAVTGGGGANGNMLFTARLTSRGVLDRSFGGAGNGRVMTPRIGGEGVLICGMTSTRAGVLTIAVQDKVAQLLPSGVVDKRFARGGIFTIPKPKGVFVNDFVTAGSGRVVAVGSTGNAIYVSRWVN
jgi:uncharacterized delta-60 repeat protein